MLSEGNALGRMRNWVEIPEPGPLAEPPAGPTKRPIPVHCRCMSIVALKAVDSSEKADDVRLCASSWVLRETKPSSLGFQEKGRENVCM